MNVVRFTEPRTSETASPREERVSRRRRLAMRGLTFSVAALPAISAALFGSVHPWAYWTVGTLTIALALSASLITRQRPRVSSHGLLVASCLFVPLGLQILPLPSAPLSRIAPGATRLASTLDLGFGTGAASSHPLSIMPALTMTCAVFMVVGAVWASSVSSAFSRGNEPARFARALIWWSVALSLLALAQKATFNGKIYWFWESQFRVSENYYGPFVNRNHFAGWMLLALSIGTGYLLGLLSTAGRHVKNNWRARVLWLGSGEAGQVILTASALVIMAVATVWSLSRSGIAGMMLALAVLAMASVRALHSRRRVWASVTFIALAATLAVTWKGAGALSEWYGNTRTLEWRFALWRDSLAPLREFYLLGSGLNTYGAVMLFYPQTDVMVHAQQTHNDYLQLAIEGGVLVIVPWLVALGVMVRRAVARLRQPQHPMIWWIRMGAIAGLCGIALQELTEFSLQIPAVALLFATCIGLALHEPGPVETRRHDSKRTDLIRASNERMQLC